MDYMAVNFLNEPFRNRPFNTDNRRQCFNVNIRDDDVFEEDPESFTVTIRNSVQSEAVTVAPDVVTITIVSDDPEPTTRPSPTPPRKWEYKLDDGIQEAQGKLYYKVNSTSIAIFPGLKLSSTLYTNTYLPCGVLVQIP